MLFLGIDPGKGGGLAMLEAGAGARAVRMPATDRDIYDLLCSVRGCGTFAAIEQVHAMPKQGVSSTFTFGMGYGGLRMALVACDIPFDEVTPRRWQKDMSCLSGGDKNVTKRRAQELFPDVHVTHAVADALLIAEWLRRSRLQGPHV